MRFVLPCLLWTVVALAATSPALGATSDASADASDAASRLPFDQPRAGLYTAGQPTIEQLRQAAAAGVTTVIDLRAADKDRGHDEPTEAATLGLRYIALPVAGAAGVTVDSARQLHALIAASDGPVLVHCASGNRVGALLALAAAHVDGADNDTALAFGRAAGLGSLLPVVEKHMPATAADMAGQNTEQP